MKTQLITSILLSSALLLISCNQEEKETGVSSDIINVPATASGTVAAEPGTAPVILFPEEKHDFGEIMQGEKVSYSFLFKNTGGSDLVISSAQGSCGCTVPQFPKDPIKPGAEGKVDVVFNSEGKSGKVQKTVTLVTNCNPSTKMLTISASVIVPEGK
jgi:predicted small secreted protein